jgi:hypothetical protein
MFEGLVVVYYPKKNGNRTRQTFHFQFFTFNSCTPSPSIKKIAVFKQPIDYKYIIENERFSLLQFSSIYFNLLQFNPVILLSFTSIYFNSLQFTSTYCNR